MSASPRRRWAPTSRRAKSWSRTASPTPCFSKRFCGRRVRCAGYPNLNGDYLSDACAAQVADWHGGRRQYRRRLRVLRSYPCTAPSTPQGCHQSIERHSVRLHDVHHMGWKEVSGLIERGITETMSKSASPTICIARWKAP